MERNSRLTISDDGKTYAMMNDWYGWTCVLDGDYLIIEGRPFYKVSGPTCYKRFLKEFIESHYTK